MLTGTDSYFVRTSGCNLRCWFCDTPYASWKPSGPQVPVESIVDAVIESGLKHAVVTGGEPMLPATSIDLCELLRAAGIHVTIETAGTVDRDIPCDLMSISPKLACSTPDADQHPSWNRLHEQRRMPIEIMKRLIKDAPEFQIKFVVDSPADYTEVNEIVTQLDVDTDHIWIMPQGSTIEALDQSITWLKPWAESAGYRYCERMQIRWFGNRRGT